MIKFAIIGTSCAGKTTTVYNVVGQLRKKGYHIEGLTSTDRNYPFAKEKLDYMNEAQSYIILQQMFLENRIQLRDDVEIIVTDRSTIDFFAYYEYYIKNKDDVYYDMIKKISFDWLQTYDTIFYLNPLPWVDDNKRPDDSSRMNVDSVLQSFLKNITNLIIVPNEVNREDFIKEEIEKRCKILFK